MLTGSTTALMAQIRRLELFMQKKKTEKDPHPIIENLFEFHLLFIKRSEGSCSLTQIQCFD